MRVLKYTWIPCILRATYLAGMNQLLHKNHIIFVLAHTTIHHIVFEFFLKSHKNQAVYNGLPKPTSSLFHHMLQESYWKELLCILRCFHVKNSEKKLKSAKPVWRTDKCLEHFPHINSLCACRTPSCWYTFYCWYSNWCEGYNQHKSMHILWKDNYTLSVFKNLGPMSGFQPGTDPCILWYSVVPSSSHQCLWWFQTGHLIL